MKGIEKIQVSIQFDTDEIEVGELIRKEKTIYFKYYPTFIRRGLEISPIKLKLGTETQVANQIPFDGLFGVFSDSLPDGWGRLLLDRTLIEKGFDLSKITALDRLAYIGSKGMGALIYKPEMHFENQFDFVFELDEIAQATEQIINGNAIDIIDELYALGGSSGGAKPKILVGYNAATDHLITNTNTLPTGYEPWIIKFPSSFDRLDIANIEYAYHKMAITSGIEMSECKLFTGKSGRAYFGTKRFDRIGNKRLHLQSAAGIMHDNFRASTLDYGNIMDCAFQLENNTLAYEKILRLAAFNVFTHNRDDHSKNISFLMDEVGTWKIAPAYDLTFSNSSHGWHSTMVAGESANPTKKHLLDLADHFKVKNAALIISHVQEIVAEWEVFADKAEVSGTSKKLISKTLN